MTRLSSSPFDVIVVTSPDPSAARAAEAGPLQALVLALPVTTKILSTCDPFGSRCGSGGGTLAALDAALASWTSTRVTNPSPPTVLIVHAGGESSRCPTQMALGKAWTSLPLSLLPQQQEQQQHSNDDESTVEIGNPTFLMIQTLNRVCQGIPQGTVVVAASDTLLYLPLEAPIQWNDLEDSVLGVAVPAPVNTAAHHGVFVLGNDLKVAQFLQKPLVETMRQTPGCVFGDDDSEEEHAWIDTGVVAFLPKSATALRHLACGLLQCCTETGLRAMWQSNHSHPAATSLQDFAKENTLRVELYTHFLLALSTGEHLALDTYLTNHRADLSGEILTGIYQALSPFPLKVLALPKGQFLHLGTTKELVDFVLHGSQSDKQRQDVNRKCQNFGTLIGLVNHANSFVPSKAILPHCDCVIVNSALQAPDSSIQAETVVEHTVVSCSNRLRIGRHCLVSGVRGPCPILEIPDNMCLQMLPVTWEGQDALVYMYLGLDDGIKTRDTMYGINVNDLLRSAGLNSTDIWDDDETSPTLWTARLHPVIVVKRHNGTSPSWDNQPCVHQELFSWITLLQQQQQYSPNGHDKNISSMMKDSLGYWKSLPRLSLADIRVHADAYSEFQYRDKLQSTIIPMMKLQQFRLVKECLMQRQHVECNIDFVSWRFKSSDHVGHELMPTLTMMDEIVTDCMERGHYDVCGRVFMLVSTFLNSLASGVNDEKVNDKEEENYARNGASGALDDTGFDAEVRVLRRSTSDTVQLRQSIEVLQSRRNNLVMGLSSTSKPKSNLIMCAMAMEAAASVMTEICVSGCRSTPSSLDSIATRVDPVPLDTWVVASAPGRIDLAGGWSDTPPICFEHGGAVCCLAVTVDGCKPLSSRCRMVSGGHGITLRTESRQCRTGDLVSHKTITLGKLGDLADFRNPAADCALIKCALVYCGLVPMAKMESNPDDDLQPYINILCGSPTNVGIELVSTSLLPHGSGMGTSSILGGCILASFARCIGLDFIGDDAEKGDNHLIHVVLMLEQLLTTGGGWQDQVGGLIGGVKLGTSKAHVLPLCTAVERVQISPATEELLNDRLLLAFTGQTRLAKNILVNVLRRWSCRSDDIVTTVQDLVTGAQTAVDALQNCDFHSLGICLNNYWIQKKAMAGEDSGVEPDVVRELLTELLSRGEIAGGALCGAGGGGFLVMLTGEGRTSAEVRELCKTDLVGVHDEIGLFTWHECQVCQEGLTTRITSHEEGSPLEFFDLSWHAVH